MSTSDSSYEEELARLYQCFPEQPYADNLPYNYNAVIIPPVRWHWVEGKLIGHYEKSTLPALGVAWPTTVIKFPEYRFLKSFLATVTHISPTVSLLHDKAKNSPNPTVVYYGQLPAQLLHSTIPIIGIIREEMHGFEYKRELVEGAAYIYVGQTDRHIDDTIEATIEDMLALIEFDGEKK